MTNSNFPYCLAITPQVELWDTSSPILFLNEDCIPYDPDGIYADILKDSVVFNDPFPDFQSQEEGAMYVLNQLDYIQPFLSDILNSVHKCKMSDKQWFRIIGMHIYNYISFIHIAYVRLERVKREYPNVYVTVPHNYNPQLFHNSVNFTNTLVQKSYCYLYLYSIVASELNIEVREITCSQCITEEIDTEEIDTEEIDTEEIDTEEIDTEKQSLRTQIGKRFGTINGVRYILKTGDLTPIKRKMYFLWQQTPLYAPLRKKKCNDALLYKGFYCGNPSPQFFEKTKLPWLSLDHIPFYVSSHPQLNEEIRNEIRQKLLDIPDLDEFMNMALKNMHHWIPTDYIEGFEQLLTYSKEHYPWNSTPRGVVTEFSHILDNAFTLWIAHVHEKGTPFHIFQHGGGYHVLNFYTFLCELRLSDMFYVWCNPMYNKGKLRGISSLKLIEAKKKSNTKRLQRNNILYGVTHFQQQLFDYTYTIPQSTTTYLFKNLCDFISNLSPTCFEDIRIRFKHGEKSGYRVQQLRDHFPHLITEGMEQSFIERLSECRLYVAEILSTSAMESFHSNHPTICIWDPVCASINEEANPFMDELKRVGIVFESPVGAAHAVNEIYDDVDIWWNAPERVEAVRKFCDRFAYVAPDPVAEWREEFKRYLK